LREGHYDQAGLEAATLRIFGACLAVAHPRLAHGDSADAGHDLALGQMAVTHNAPTAVRGLEISGPGQKVGNLRLDRLGQKGARPIAQDLGQLVGRSPWLKQFDDVIKEAVADTSISGRRVARELDGVMTRRGKTMIPRPANKSSSSK
jgi:hypothetical protein